MTIRAFRPEDASALVAVAKSCARGETDFVLVPLWESERDLFAEFERHGVDPEQHLLVGEAGDGTRRRLRRLRAPAPRDRRGPRVSRSSRATRAARGWAASCCARRSRSAPSASA